MSAPEKLSGDTKRTMYWFRVGLGVREGLRMHHVSGQILVDPDINAQYRQLRKTPGVSEEIKTELRRKRRPLGNITEHCLVQVARVKTLGEWLGLKEEVILDMKMGAILHDAFKIQEIMQMRAAEKRGESPLAASKAQSAEDDRILQGAGFNARTLWLANSSGGQAAAMLETQRILGKPVLSDEDYAYLINHIVDDCSVNFDCIRPSWTDPTGKQTNIIDFRAEESKSKPGYRKVSEEIVKELQDDPVLGGMNTYDAMAMVSHQIEQKLAAAIYSKTGEMVNPLAIPELVDRKIQQDIANVQHPQR